MDLNTFQPQAGMDVVGSDGEKVGQVDAVERDHILVRKGFFFPEDHFIPFTAINSYEDDKLFLNVTKDDALKQNWSSAPAGGFTGVAEGSNYTNTDELQGDDRGYVADVNDVNYEATLEGQDRDTNYQQDDHQTIELAEEELEATKHEVDRGSVRLSKSVVEEQQSVDVPLREEEVNITRRDVDRAVDGNHTFEDTTIEVPVRGEEVEFEKVARVVEEVDVDKTTKEHTEQFTETVRREELKVTDDGSLDAVEGDGDRDLLDKAKDAIDMDEDGGVF